jgi:hypothetical protein
MGQVWLYFILNEAERSLELDETDVAYCAYIYEQKKQEYGGNIAGVKIFDENGNPYQVKYPEVAEQMRTERRSIREHIAEYGENQAILRYTIPI